MPYFAVIFHTVDDYVSRRAQFREAHVAMVRDAHARGEIVLAGAFADPVDRALLIFKGPDRSVADRFVDADPYTKNGLVKKVEIREWTVVTPQEAKR